MKHFITLVVFFCLCSMTNNYKLIMIRAKEVLKEAKAIKKIVVIGYKDSTMLYRLENSKDTLKINCNVKKSAEAFRQLQIKKGLISKNALAGKWPTIGQKVLIVIGPKDNVSLFAYYKNGDFRFWDPNSLPFANSMFEIIKERPFKPLPECDNYNDDNSKFFICNDGFLAIALDIQQRN